MNTKSILGIGNALTDILAVLPDDSFLKMYHLPKGSMQFVDMETGNKIFESLKPYGCIMWQAVRPRTPSPALPSSAWTLHL